MSEPLPDSPEELSVPPEAPKLTPEEKVAMVKQNLLNQLNQFHNNTFNFVSGLPIDEESRRFALANLVQGLRWAQDGIAVLKFEVENVQNIPPVPPVDGEVPPPAAEVTPQPEGESQC